MKNPANSGGFSTPSLPRYNPDRATAAAARNIPGAAWITDEVVADTINVWAPYYGGKLTPHEAVEILTNFMGFVDALVQAERKT